MFLLSAFVLEITDVLGPLVTSLFSRIQQSPRPLDDVAVLDAPTPPSSKGFFLHLPVSSLQGVEQYTCCLGCIGVYGQMLTLLVYIYIFIYLFIYLI